jgi:hypothetical protein
MAQKSVKDGEVEGSENEIHLFHVRGAITGGLYPSVPLCLLDGSHWGAEHERSRHQLVHLVNGKLVKDKKALEEVAQQRANDERVGKMRKMADERLVTGRGGYEIPSGQGPRDHKMSQEKRRAYGV